MIKGKGTTNGGFLFHVFERLLNQVSYRLEITNFSLLLLALDLSWPSSTGESDLLPLL